MTPELISHWMDTFHLTAPFEGFVIAIVVIAIVAFALKKLG